MVASQVAELTESLMDHSVNPCTDFYGHVCGQWIKNTKRPSSFMIDVAQNFSDTLHEALSRPHLHGDNHELMQDAAIFYNSCLTYLKRDADIKASTDELFEALNISVSKWLNENDPMQFFRDILRLSLVNRFHTLVAFSVIEDSGNVTLKVTRWYPLHNFIPPESMDRVKEYVNRLFKVVGEDKASDTVVEEVLKLDKNRGIFVDADDSGPKLQDVQCQTFPGKTWIEVLHKELSLAENVPVVTTGMDTICKELNEVLVKTKSVARALYMVALVSRSVLDVDYTQSGNSDAYRVRRKCYLEMQFAFEDTWLHLLSGLLNVTKGNEEVIDAYMGITGKQVKSRVAAWTWMAEEDRRAAIEQFTRIRMVRFYGASMRKQAVRCSSRKKVTSTDFVSNVVNLYVRDIKSCLLPSVDRRDDLGLKRFLLGTDLVAYHSNVVVPPMFVLPPLYYRHVEDDKFINIAVFVNNLASKVIYSTLDRGADTYGWSNGTSANYSRIQDCYARQTANLHAKLNDSQFDRAFSVMESLRIAYAAKRQYDRDLDAPVDLNTMDFESAYASCLFAAASAPTFIDIFGCQAEDTMTAISSCYVH
ncbi:endothelin-converting enzyme 2-like [Rhipicephalus sanguineus]|uniref:endothelin-converting enzyme 2-like n=1 Tax=Rhipicephalus sanguineus TaxID=34632 RepID=UPI0018941363|nr:endothelin-converting enzyme 2-like [Rhipicephalus sanguineus]